MKIYKNICWLTLALLMNILSGCSDIESPTVDSVLPKDILHEVRVSTSSVRMKLGDSLKLDPLMFAVDGTQLDVANIDQITWSSSNSENVTVDSSGLIIGWKVSASPINITVSVKYNLVTKTHRIPVYVTSEQLDITSIKLVALDSQKITSRTFPGVNSLRRYPRVRIDLYQEDSIVQSGLNLPLTVPPGVTLQYIPAERVFYVFRTDGVTGKFNIKLSGNMYGNEVGDSLEFISLYSAYSRHSQVGYKATFFEDVNSPFGLGISIDSSAWYDAIDRSISYIMQPCAIIIFDVYGRELFDFVPLLYNQMFSYPKIDIVFDDSANVSDCNSSNPDMSTYEPEVIGGNVYGWSPFKKVIRKSSTIGEVNWYMRDAETKEPIGISGKYIARELEI